MDEVWLRRDYSALWRLPEPLPPRCPPLVRLGLVLAVIGVALLAGLIETGE
jgi:hypothetical protein